MLSLLDSLGKQSPARPHKMDSEWTDPHTGPAPLDSYMTQTSLPPTSPYSKLHDVRNAVNEGNAPLQEKRFADIKNILHKVHLSRNYLEENLDTLLRNRQESQVYSLLGSITNDSTVAEKLRIQKMVDAHIQDMNTDLESEVFDELLKLKAAKKTMANFMIPERDTDGVTATANTRNNLKTVGVRGTKAKVAAKVNTGLRMEGRRDVGIKKAVGKQTLPPANVKKTKQVELLDHDVSKSQIHGKASYRPQRTTQRDPYLRYHTSPKPTLPRIAASGAAAHGVMMATAKTQTPGYPMVTSGHQYYYNAATHQQWAGHQGPAGGQFFPMAVPLGLPRKDGGLTKPVVLPSGSSVAYGPFTSTPMTGSNLPVPNTDSLPSGVPVMRRPVTSTPMAGASLPVHISDNIDENDGESTVTEEDEDGIALPGFTAPPSKPYHGPQFPPQAPMLNDDQGTEAGMLCTDHQPHTDLLRNKAMDWVEQELMARMISELYVEQQQAVPHTPVRVPPPPQHTADSDTLSEPSAHDSLIAETMGNDGFELFVDAGQPVDDKLVTALIKDVIMEQISSALGQRTAAQIDSYEPSIIRHNSPPPRPKPSPRYHVSPVASDRVRMPETLVATPDVTPRNSPVLRAYRQQSPPRTPDMTPTPSLVDQPDVISVSEASESIVENKPFDSTQPEDDMAKLPSEAFEPQFDVRTPLATPPQSPLPTEFSTPSPSLKEVTPPPESPPTPPPVPQTDTLPEPDLQATLSNSDLEFPGQDEAERATRMVTFLGATEDEADVAVLPTSFQQAPAASSPPPTMSPLHSPPVERQLSASLDESTPSSSIVSDTVNDPVSEGQWLFTPHSEGEVPPIAALDTDQLLAHAFYQGRPVGRGRAAVDDTLGDTEDLYHDSEGEVIPQGLGGVDPMLHMLNRLSAPHSAVPPQRLASNDRSMIVDRSLGEVSLGQQPQYPEPNMHKVTTVGNSKSQGEMRKYVPEERTPSARLYQPSRSGLRATAESYHTLAETAEGPSELGQSGGTMISASGHAHSDLETMTSDRMNMLDILQSHDFLATTQSDQATLQSNGVAVGWSADFSQHARLRQSLGSTSDMSLSPGMTKTLERSEEDLNQSKRLTYSVNSDTDLRMSQRYADSLESTGRLQGTAGQSLHGVSGLRQVSVAIPSMGEESSGTEASIDDVSELSLGGNL